MRLFYNEHIWRGLSSLALVCHIMYYRLQNFVLQNLYMLTNA